MKKLVEVSVYEHPVHSLILDPGDAIWKKYFNEKEIKEIKTHNLKPLPIIPKDIEDYPDLYDRTWFSAKELYKHADKQSYGLIIEFSKKWIKESMVRVSEQFLHSEQLDLNDYSEADLMHDIWPFVYRAFRDKHIKAMLGERSSVSVSLGRNEARSLEVVEKRQRKKFGAKVDILFKHGNNELGACEAGKNDVTTVDDKYLDDGLVKLPKTLRDMLSALIQKNPAQINNLATIGFLIMSLNLEIIKMDVPSGEYVTRVSRTSKMEFPSTLDTLSLGFIPLLEATSKGKEVMKDTIKVANSKKRKSVELGTSSTDSATILPPSFVRHL